MWLRRFTRLRCRAATLTIPALLVVLAACSSGSPPAPGGQVDGTAVGSELPPAALTMFEQAAASMAGGDYVEAELRFKELLLQHPGLPAAHTNLAIIHNNNGNDSAARAEIDAALAADPEFAPALNQSGVLFRKNGNFEAAEAAYMKAVTVSPGYALAHYNLGVLNELYLQRFDIALQHYEQYQDLAGSDEQVDRWIADLRRRVASNQSSANVAE